MKSFISGIGTLAVLLIISGLYSRNLRLVLIGAIPLIILISIGFILYLKQRKTLKELSSGVEEGFERFRNTWEKIQVEFDNCEIKDSSYSQEIIDESMSRFGHLNLDYGKVIGQEQHGQSLLIYNYAGVNGTEKFLQAFPLDADTLKVYVIRNLLTLYVNPQDRNYFFIDLKSA